MGRPLPRENNEIAGIVFLGPLQEWKEGLNQVRLGLGGGSTFNESASPL